MNKIKVAGALVFLLSIILALLSVAITDKNRENITNLSFIHQQKAYTQEISKSIFYTYRRGEKPSEKLEEIIKSYLENQNQFKKNNLIFKLSNSFYDDIERFRIQQQTTTGYNAIITRKLVNRIYHNNVLLIHEFNNLIEAEESQFHNKLNFYKKFQYILFIILIALLLYLFTQIRVIIEFIQKFSKTSKDIIENSTIQGVEPIEIKNRNKELEEANENYNLLVKKIENSIKTSTQSIEHSTKSLEEVAKNIEDFMELLSKMNEDEVDEMFAKEDAVIDSLEVLMSLRKRLKGLNMELEGLVGSVRPNKKVKSPHG